MGDKDIRDYAVENFLYEVPKVRRKLFVKEVQKIVLSLTKDEIVFVEGVAGLDHKLYRKCL